jgi:hypothetical protein
MMTGQEKKEAVSSFLVAGHDLTVQLFQLNFMGFLIGGPEIR